MPFFLGLLFAVWSGEGGKGLGGGCTVCVCFLVGSSVFSWGLLWLLFAAKWFCWGFLFSQGAGRVVHELWLIAYQRTCKNYSDPA